MSCSPTASSVPGVATPEITSDYTESPTSGLTGGAGGYTASGGSGYSGGPGVTQDAIEPLEGEAAGKTTGPPPERISPIDAGAPAPFAGVLFSSEAAAWVIAQQEGQAERIRIERQDATSLVEAQCELRVDDLETRSQADRDTMQVQLDYQSIVIESHRRQIEELEKKGTGPSPYLWGGLGAVGGAIITLGIVFAVNSASN